MKKLSRRNKKITFTAISVFLGVVLAVLLWMGASSIITNMMLEERDSVIEPLEMKRAMLRRELSALENDLALSLPNGSTVTTVCTDLDVRLYDILFPIYEGVADDQNPGTLKIVGTMCLSEKEMPGIDGNISLNQYNEMIDAGWSTVLFVSKENAKNLTAYVNSMKERLDALSMSMPNALYFELNAYSMNLDDEILSLGFKSVMHHKEHGLPLFGTDTAPELWRVGCINWNSGDTVTIFGQLVSTSGHLVITYSFDRTIKEDHFPPEIYGAYYSFNKMLSMFRVNSENGNLEVGNVEAGRENYAEYEKVHIEMLIIQEARRLMLEEQIAQLDDMIFDIYRNYGELE